MGFLTQPISLTSIFTGGSARQIDTIEVDVIMSEDTSDVLTITKQPVQQGATITDHAFMEPTVLNMTVFFKDSFFTSLSETYEKLRKLQSSRVPIKVTTPKRTYTNMLIATLRNTTDKNTENCLSISMSLQEVIRVSVTTTQVERTKQRNPGTTGATQKAGNKSALRTGADIFTGR
jgi:hypothetical protein